MEPPPADACWSIRLLLGVNHDRAATDRLVEAVLVNDVLPSVLPPDSDADSGAEAEPSSVVPGGVLFEASPSSGDAARAAAARALVLRNSLRFRSSPIRQLCAEDLLLRDPQDVQAALHVEGVD